MPQHDTCTDPTISPEGDSSSRLGHQDVNVTNTRADAVAFRHSGWAHYRARALEALRRAVKSSAVVERFEHCGQNAWVMQSDDDPPRYKVVADTCKSRFCVPCRRAKALRIADAVARHIDPKDCRFITLTLRSRDEPLTDQLDRIYRCFRRLRSTDTWRQTQYGGIAFLELTVSNDLWHPHFHIISHGTWLDVKELRRTWLKVTGDSHDADIRAIGTVEGAAYEVAKYAGKSFNATVYRSRDHLSEAVIALQKRRTFTTFGTWRNIDLNPPHHPDEDSVVWQPVDTLANILALARAGDESSRAIVAQLLKETGQCKLDAIESPSRSPPDYPGNPTARHAFDPSALTPSKS